MSTDISEPDGYTPRQLREMDDDEARRTLTVDEYERREKLLDLHEQAAETEERFAAEDERVTDLTVHADADSLGTEVDLYGNDVLVHIDSDDEKVHETAEALDDRFGDAHEVDDLDADDREDIAAGLQDLLDAAIIRWNGHEWADLPESERGAVLADAREKWGVDGLLLAWVDVATAIREDREERVGVVESFR